jgi:hypothetical protein
MASQEPRSLGSPAVPMPSAANVSAVSNRHARAGSKLMRELVSSFRGLMILNAARWMDSRELEVLQQSRTSPPGYEERAGIDLETVERTLFNVQMREQLRGNKESALLTAIARMPFATVPLEEDDDLKEKLVEQLSFAIIEHANEHVMHATTENPLEDTNFVVQLAMIHRAVPFPFSQGTLLNILQRSIQTSKAVFQTGLENIVHDNTTAHDILQLEEEKAADSTLAESFLKRAAHALAERIGNQRNAEGETPDISAREFISMKLSPPLSSRGRGRPP